AVGRSRAGAPRLRRRDELLDDEPAAQERDASEHHVDDEQAARHQLLALPGTAGRTNPETVSVTSKSLGWVMLTTRILSSWTGRSFGALSSRASRSTSWRISQDTAISTGISSSSPRSAGGRMRSLRTSVLACAAMSFTIFCSFDADTARAAAGGEAPHRC